MAIRIMTSGLLATMMACGLLVSCSTSTISYSDETDPEVLRNWLHQSDQKIIVLSEEVRQLREDMQIARGPDAALEISQMRSEIVQKEAEIQKLKADKLKIIERLEELGESVEE
jgi:TolA-binding protein